MTETQEQLIRNIEQQLENLMLLDEDLAWEYESALYYDCNDDEEPQPIVENFTPELLSELEKVVYDRDSTTKTMKLYILKEVLYDYTDGMCIIAAESMPQCEQIFMEEFGYFTDCNGERIKDEKTQKEFNNAKVTIIESVGLDEAGIVEYVYGGG